MKTSMPFDEKVDILSDESSSSDGENDGSAGNSNKDVAIDQPASEIISEGVEIRRAQMYQEYMKQIPIPVQRGSVIPFTSWTGLGRSIKQLYGQPLHYLTNIRLKQWDQLRLDADDEHTPLDTIFHPCKAEASIWLVEEVHRHTVSHRCLAKLWAVDPMYHAFIDPIFTQLGSSAHPNT